MRAGARRQLPGGQLAARAHRLEQTETVAQYHQRACPDRTEIADHAAEQRIQFVLIQL